MNHLVRWKLNLFSIFLPTNSIFFFFQDREEQNYGIEIIQSNGQNGFKKKQTHLTDLSHISKINIPNTIPEKVQIYRSQSVGNRVTVKQANTNGTANDTRSFFSDSLLNNISFGKKSESRSLGDIHKHSSGTLSRPDIFYQVQENDFEMKLINA